MESRSTITIEQNDTIDLKPPYIILSNHVTNWDPFYINCYVNEPICFVASDSLFRKPLLKPLLHYVNAIPKTKYKSDTRTIRGMVNAKKENRVIGLFPEGNRNWDGQTEPIPLAVSKLVKMLTIPVVVAKIKGGHLSHPRWAQSFRKGPISISFEKILNPNQIEDLSTDQVLQVIRQSLDHDERSWRKETEATYSGKKLANYLERYLFICPDCKELGTLRSKKDKLICRVCSSSVTYTKAGTFEKNGQAADFLTPKDWNNWQLEELRDMIFSDSTTRTFQERMKDSVKLYRADQDGNFSLLSEGSLLWEDRSILFMGDHNLEQNFPIVKLDGANVQMNNRLEFYLEESLYSVVFHHPYTSAYKWLQSILYYQEKQAFEEDGVLL
ncbi:lysophospholipid acyltransferase family protein [Bacillus coahuilensis]|uniref:lysophospholipid acyltransferase family protein n=2 Tax=Bacillus coahuilensis TaxID=408580 RepID=UPI00187C0A05|nr:lysophospholipid acyltransferase family protein [Bacillus coahuilensis]